MTDFCLRDATPKDAPAIAAIWNPIIRDTVVTFNPTARSHDDLRRMIQSRHADGHAFMVAQQAGRLLGFATYAQFRGGLGYGRTMEHTINLAPQARGAGVGQALLRALEDHAARAGHHIMVAAVTGSNVASIRFHQRQGYQITGTMPQVGWKFGTFHDLVLMQKTLQISDAQVQSAP